MNKKKKLKILHNIFFIIFLCIGIFNVKNYGISWDEQSSRAIGFMNGKYIIEKGSKYLSFLKLEENIQKNFSPNHNQYNLNDYPERAYGPSFELPAAIIEFLFGFKEEKNIFLLRHYLNFIVFFISSLIFYKFVFKKYNSYSLAFVCWLLLVLTPRIFAESFYNSKDIIFMSYMILSNYFGYSFVKKDNFKNIICFSFFTALSVAIRPIGIANLFFYLFFYLIIKKKIILKKIISIFVLTLLFIYFLWPYLWEFSFNKIIFMFHYFANIPWDKNVFYFGNFYKANNLPWHYLPTWLVITIPEIIIILSIISLIVLVFYNTSKENIFFFIYFFFPIILVVILKPNQFDGWRHLYFLYPIIIIFSFSFYEKLNHLKKSLLVFSCYLFSIYLFMWNYNNNPYQFLYFNNFLPSKYTNNFEKDYWGLTNKQLIEYVNKTYSGNIYYKAYNSNFDLSLKVLNKKDKNKFIKVTDENKNINQYFIFINNRFLTYNQILNLKNDTTIVKEIFFNNTFINGVYIKKNKL